jgi:hypothetical protein
MLASVLIALWRTAAWAVHPANIEAFNRRTSAPRCTTLTEFSTPKSILERVGIARRSLDTTGPFVTTRQSGSFSLRKWGIRRKPDATVLAAHW